MIDITSNQAKYILLEMLEFNERSILDTYYMVQIAKLFDIIEEVKESIFQFHPTFDKDGRNQTFPHFYKEMLFHTIMWELCIRVAAKYLTNKDLIEDFGLFCQDIWLDDKDNNIFVKWFTKTDLRNMTVDEIVNKADEFIIENNLHPKTIYNLS